MSIRYNNFHAHSHYSNIYTLDCIVKPEHYIGRAKELGHTTYSTCEHGYTGNYFEAYDLCKKNGLKMIYAVEAYYVDNRLEKDNSNYHIVLVALNKNGFRQINSIISKANLDGFYYRPRIDLELLLTLNPNDVIVTTACIGGRISGDNAEENFIIPVHNHFKNNLFLEVQAHVDGYQAKYNERILELHNNYGIELIHANDSHYIYPKDAKDRSLFLLGKDMKYGAEDNFILDYPDTETILARYKEQNILTSEQVIKAIKNTLIFDACEDMGFTKDIKMPTIYPNENVNKKLKQIINTKWKKECKHIPKDRHGEYLEAIRYEMDIIEKTNMADYFLLNERIIDKAINEYGGVLTRSGRGSSVSFYINKLLGFTEIDRLAAEVTLYPTRFMSVSRILQTKSLADIDFNFADPEPAVKAAREVLGEDNIYIMIAYGTMQDSAAFRNLCRAYNLDVNEYNDIAKNIDQYTEHPKWGKLIQESKKFIGVIDSIAPSPCSYLILDKPISEEIGIMKIKDEFCACLDGYQAEVQKYLKNDFLTVKVWQLISQAFEEINKPIPSIRELKPLLDDNVWGLYDKGLTATLNQVDTASATPLVQKYKPKSIAELTAFVAAIRPGFASLLQNFLNRKQHTTGIKELDELLSDSFQYMLYQESLMKFLVWCGLPEDETYGIIKLVAKKRFKEHELIALKSKLLKGFIDKTGSDSGFTETWQVVEDSAGYGFNASHALSVAWDSIYGAYLKANYPLEYYTVALNLFEDDTDKTSKITNELYHFGIKLSPIVFRNSRAKYSYDKVTKTIYKGIASIKYLNSQVAEELYGLRDNGYNSFVDLLVDMVEKTSINTRQLKILITLNFFKEFGYNGKLLSIYEEFFEGKNKYKKTYVQKTKEKRVLLLREFENATSNTIIPIREQIAAERKYLGFIASTYENAEDNLALVLSVYISPKYPKSSPVVTVYFLKSGIEKTYKIKREKYFHNGSPFFEVDDTLKIRNTETKPKVKKEGKKWIEIGGTDEWLTGITAYKK